MNTIVAISTPIGKGGIGIIRMSGDKSFSILEKIFVPKNKEKHKGNQIKYGKIVDEKGKIIDEVLVSYFDGPRSYTTEDMCEINSHGGYAVEKKILEECLKHGARLAEPGEFTKRAFLNGRIDLTQAEAVIDLINSRTESERKAFANQLEGNLSKKMRKIRSDVLELMADIEVNLDYPEYDVEDTTNEIIQKKLAEVKEMCVLLSESYKNGKIIKEGIKTVIVGKPNVGKSSLLNLMLNEERAIVSDIEGTTRDTIEESVEVNGVQLKIIDTAGIRNTSDQIEKIGVKKSIDTISQADLVLAIFDDSRAIEEEDIKILELIKNKKAIVIINKKDLKANNLEEDLIKKYKIKTIPFSTKDETGLKELYKTIEDMFNIQEIEKDEGELITNLRQKEHIDQCINLINQVEESIKKNLTMDVISMQIKQILEELRRNYRRERIRRYYKQNIFKVLPWKVEMTKRQKTKTQWLQIKNSTLFDNVFLTR